MLEGVLLEVRAFVVRLPQMCVNLGLFLRGGWLVTVLWWSRLHARKQILALLGISWRRERSTPEISKYLAAVVVVRDRDHGTHHAVLRIIGDGVQVFRLLMPPCRPECYTPNRVNI